MCGSCVIQRQRQFFSSCVCVACVCSYQVGTTPSFTELPKNHCDRMKAFKETEKPLSECPPEKDPKWRFFWRIGERPNSSKHADLNAEAVVPDGFPEWKDVMDTWGNKLLQCVRDVSEMAASGFDLPRKTFSDMMDKAPHLLGTRKSSACTS